MASGEVGYIKRFWELADRLVESHPIVIDRPGGSSHPRFPEIVYPFDYGYLDGTGAVDGDSVDCWRGSLDDLDVTVDIVKADSEVKWLIGCTPEKMQSALDTHRD